MLKDNKLIFAVIAFALLVGVAGLSKVFSGEIILTRSFPLGAIDLHYYGLILAAAIFCGYQLALRRATKYQLARDEAEKILLSVLVGGAIGARLYHVATDWQVYASNPLNAFAFWNGGLSIMGAVLGGMIAILIWYYFSKISRGERFPKLLQVLDWLAPSIALGQIIGRFGNLFNYEAYGYPTNLPWKMFVPEQYRTVEFLSLEYYHPVFLYEALGSLIILATLFLIMKKKWFVTGQLFFSWLFMYNLLRFVLEHLRIDSTFVLPEIRLNAIVAAVFAAFAVCAWKWLDLRFKKPSSAEDATRN